MGIVRLLTSCGSLTESLFRAKRQPKPSERGFGRQRSKPWEGVRLVSDGAGGAKPGRTRPGNEFGKPAAGGLPSSRRRVPSGKNRCFGVQSAAGPAALRRPPPGLARASSYSPFSRKPWAWLGHTLNEAGARKTRRKLGLPERKNEEAPGQSLTGGGGPGLMLPSSNKRNPAKDSNDDPTNPARN